MRHAPSAPSTSPGARASEGRPVSPSILLAEEEVDLRRSLALALQAEGYTVLEIGRGDRLLELIRTTLRYDESFGLTDMIVADIRMPGASGLDALAELRRTDRRTPVILITGYGDAPTRERAHRLGVSVFFDKPFEVSDLLRWTRRIADGTRTETARGDGHVGRADGEGGGRRSRLLHGHRGEGPPRGEDCHRRRPPGGKATGPRPRPGRAPSRACGPSSSFSGGASPPPAAPARAPRPADPPS